MTKFNPLIIYRNIIIKNIQLLSFLSLALLFVPNDSAAQKGNTTVEAYKYFASSLSYYPQPKNIRLITDQPLPRPDYAISWQPETSVLNFGLSFQKMNKKFVFQEISLNRLSLTKGFELIELTEQTSPNFENTRILSGARTTTFLVGFRYEFGKYFSKNIENKLKFGISASLEPSYLFFSHKPNTTASFETSINKVSLDLAIIPRCSFDIGKKMSLVAKLIPNMRLLSVGRLRTNNPSLTLRQQRQPVNNDAWDFALAGALQLCYLISEPEPVNGKKKRRKKRRRR